MEINLSDRIGKRARGKPSPSRGNVNHAVFLAIRHDVKKALDDGWSILAIFQTLHEEGVVTFSYQAFRRYVNRLILSLPATEKPMLAIENSAPVQQIAQKTTGKKPDIPTGFTFNPVPNKQELL